MRALVQRVSQASVSVDKIEISAISSGLLILICAMQGDTSKTAKKIAKKAANLRIFADQDGRMNLSLLDTGGSALIVSQFTLAADTSRGNRPGFSQSAQGALAEELYEDFKESCTELGVPIQAGVFGENMQVELINDGPTTIWLNEN
jgi:D-tyrosyl-tRNA(Tyr) deacylase